MSAQHQLKHHINFSSLNEFTGGNPEFCKNLINAFIAEMEIFITKIINNPTEDEFVSFRKVHHSISPSLQMLGMTMVSKAIEDYKSAYLNNSQNLIALTDSLVQMVQESIHEANQWIASDHK